jgi:hypothetical protein
MEGAVRSLSMITIVLVGTLMLNGCGGGGSSGSGGGGGGGSGGGASGTPAGSYPVTITGTAGTTTHTVAYALTVG